MKNLTSEEYKSEIRSLIYKNKQLKRQNIYMSILYLISSVILVYIVSEATKQC